jgi:hypothetical protein
MCKYSIECWMLQHPWVVVVTAILILLVLLLPYDVTRIVRTGKVYVRCQALLWSWERGPRRTRLVMHGLLQLQRALLKAMQWAWVQYRDRLWAGVREMIKKWLD